MSRGNLGRHMSPDLGDRRWEECKQSPIYSVQAVPDDAAAKDNFLGLAVS